MNDSKSPGPYSGRNTPTARRGISDANGPNADDPVEPLPRQNSNATNSNATATSESSSSIVAPSIQVRPEFPTISRTTDPTQPLTCIISIELIRKQNAEAGLFPEDAGTHDGRHDSGHSSPHSESVHQQKSVYRSPSDQDMVMRQMSARQPSQQDSYHTINEPDFMAPNTSFNDTDDSPFHAITEDLRNRIIDWKGHPLSDLGPLQMYDLLSVRRDAAIREFYVYLFKEAIICVVEEKKRGLGRLLSNPSLDTSSIPSGTPSKGVLRLKGRIYVRHIKNVTASSAAGEMSLTIDMEDELASFILIFRDRSSLEAWRINIQTLVHMFQGRLTRSEGEYDTPHNVGEFNGSHKAARMLSGSTQTTVSTVDSLLNTSSRSTLSSSTSHGSLLNPNPSRQIHHKLSRLGEDEETSKNDSPPLPVTPRVSSGPSNSLPPIAHPTMDLILVISIPPPNTQPSAAQLKIRVIRNMLDFVVGSLQPKDRLSIVTFEVGISGRVRKTPYLMVGKAQSKHRLMKFIEEIGLRLEDGQDEFLIGGSKEEKTDVVTAVNHGGYLCSVDV